MIVVEGHHARAEGDVKSALTNLTALLTEHQPHADLTTELLSPSTPEMAADRPNGR